MIALLLLCGAQQADASSPADIVKESRQLQREALEAFTAKDWPRLLEPARRASELRPQHMGLLTLRAAAEALAGNREAALAALVRLAEAGYVVDVAAEYDFGVLAQDESFLKLAERLRQNGATLVASREALVLCDETFCAEGVAFDARDQAIYLGSFTDGRILRCAGVGEARTEEAFASTAAHGLAAAYGMAVDAERRLLWVCAGAALGKPGAEDRGALLAFDLMDGSLQRAVRGGPSDPRMLGDLVLAADGAVYATDPVGGAIVRLAPGAEAFTIILPAGHLISPQGLVLLPARARETPQLVVADYACGLFSMLCDGSALPRPLSIPNGASLLGVDGLLIHDGALIAIQNGMSPVRVVRLELDESRQRVTAIRILESAHPRYGEPTLGTITGDALLYLANAPWEDQEKHPPALLLELPSR